MSLQNAINNCSKFTKITASGNFTKDSRTKWLRIIGWGGGGGGGSGRVTSGAANRGGGGGGSCQGVFYVECDADTVDTTTSVTIGAGGAGGAGVNTDNTDGNPGTVGGQTIFGNFKTYSGAVSSAGGAGTNAVGGTGGSPPIIFYNGTAIQTTAGGGNGAFGNSVDSTQGDDVPDSTGIGQLSPTGGGGGRSTSGAGIPFTGKIGGNVTTWEATPSTILAGGTAVGGNGNDASSITADGILTGGTGGGGSTGGATPGGNGGIPGGGGGGGPAGENGATSAAAGGDGARGEVWVFEYF